MTLFDADNHYWESTDCFTRHIPESQLDDAIRVVNVEDADQDAGASTDQGDGAGVIYVGDRQFTFLADSFSENVGKPGALREMLRNLKSGMSIEENTALTKRSTPAFRGRDARLALMDEQGLDSVLMFPSLGVCVEHFMRDDPHRTYLNVQSFNRWIYEDWGFGADGRIYGVPVMSLLDLDQAITELEWLIDHGAKAIHLRPGPQAGKCPADPVFDPFWQRVNEAELLLTFHISESGFNETYSAQWGENPNPPSREMSAFQWTSFYGDLPIMQTLSGMIFYNFFTRFPKVNVVSVENGSLWVPYLMASMDKMKGMGRNGPWPGGRLKGRPSEVFKEHVFVSPYHEEDVAALAELIGAGQVLFGSDYPHPEGLAEPAAFRESLSGISEPDQSLIMGDTLATLIG